MSSFLIGLVAGLGIAIPVGAIAVLIVQVGMRCGFWCAASAGAGGATADLLYAVLAVAGGAALAVAIEAIGRPFRLGSAAILACMAILGLVRTHVPPNRSLGETATRYLRPSPAAGAVRGIRSTASNGRRWRRIRRAEGSVPPRIRGDAGLCGRFSRRCLLGRAARAPRASAAAASRPPMVYRAPRLGRVDLRVFRYPDV